MAISKTRRTHPPARAELPTDAAEPPPALHARGFVLIFWSLVLWGTLIAGAILWSVVTRGWAASLVMIRPKGWEGWVNLVLAPFSVVVWALVLTVVVSRLGPKGRPEDCDP